MFGFDYFKGKHIFIDTFRFVGGPLLEKYKINIFLSI